MMVSLTLVSSLTSAGNSKWIKQQADLVWKLRELEIHAQSGHIYKQEGNIPFIKIKKKDFIIEYRYLDNGLMQLGVYNLNGEEISFDNQVIMCIIGKYEGNNEICNKKAE